MYQRGVCLSLGTLKDCASYLTFHHGAQCSELKAGHLNWTINVSELNILLVCNLNPTEICELTEYVMVLVQSSAPSPSKETSLTDILSKCYFVIGTLQQLNLGMSRRKAMNAYTFKLQRSSVFMLIAEASLYSSGKEMPSLFSSNKFFWFSTGVTFQGGIWIQIT